MLDAFKYKRRMIKTDCSYLLEQKLESVQTLPRTSCIGGLDAENSEIVRLILKQLQGLVIWLRHDAFD